MILKTFKKYQNKWDYPHNVLQINVTSQSENLGRVGRALIFTPGPARAGPDIFLSLV